MAQYEIDNIVKEVRLIIDENEDNEKLITEADEVASNTDAITKAMVVQGIDTVHRLAPLWRLSPLGVGYTVSLAEYKKGKRGYLPTDFLRLVYAEAEDWPGLMSDTVDIDSDEYKMQSSKFAGIRGSVEKPVVAIVPGMIIPAAKGADAQGTDPGLIIEVYTTNKPTVNIAYVKKANVTNNKVEIAEKCKEAVLYMIAKYYMVNVGELERAKSYDAVAAELLGLTTGDEQ